MDLFPYQVEGAEFLARTGRALLADEMGLGKTAQAIHAAAAVGNRVAVVCPASLRETWKREFFRFWPAEDDYDLVVESYDKAARGDLGGWRGDVLILDEAHYLKSYKAKRTKAIFGTKCDGVGGLIERAAHVFCLTGTPTPNNPSELWPMLRAVMPGAIEAPTKAGTMRPMPYWTFVERFCVTQDTGFGIKIVKGKNLSELKVRIAPFILRRKKNEVLTDLPPIRFDVLPVEGRLPKENAAEIEAISQALDRDGVRALQELAPHVAQLRRITGMAKTPGVIEWIKEYFESGGEKLVVFAHHKDVLDSLGMAFADRAVWVRGESTGVARSNAVDAFQTDPKVKLFIGQIQAAGTGLTLTAASDVLFVESSWVPAENEQAAMRVHRIGQRNACVIRFAMLAGSLDERIQRAVMRKTADISRLFS